MSGCPVAIEGMNRLLDSNILIYAAQPAPHAILTNGGALCLSRFDRAATNASGLLIRVSRSARFHPGS